VGGTSGGVMSAAVTALTTSVDQFCARPPAATPDDLAAELIQLRHQCDRLELEFSRSAAAFSATDEYDSWGSVTPVDWIRIHCHMTGPAAADRVVVGKQTPKLAQSVGAMQAREIGFAHLAVMSRTAEALSRSGGTQRFDEGALLARARESSPGKFHYICHHARHAADPRGYAAAQAELVENRRLALTVWQDGSFLLSGMLDPVGGAALRTALEPLARRSGARDQRGRSRRLADALVELSTHALDSGLIPSQASQRAHLQVTTSLETLLDLGGAPAAEMEFSLPISSRTVERLACDCTVTRILLGADSAFIDVGRARRVVSGPTRRALNARDGSCTWPGCDRPATWSAAHHVVHWTHGGTTDLPNLILLCHRHHWMVHEGGWQLVRTDEGQLLTVPPPVELYERALRASPQSTGELADLAV
jgi:hypothetical protein